MRARVVTIGSTRNQNSFVRMSWNGWFRRVRHFSDISDCERTASPCKYRRHAIVVYVVRCWCWRTTRKFSRRFFPPKTVYATGTRLQQATLRTHFSSSPRRSGQPLIRVGNNNEQLRVAVSSTRVYPSRETVRGTRNAFYKIVHHPRVDYIAKPGMGLFCSCL